MSAGVPMEQLQSGVQYVQLESGQQLMYDPNMVTYAQAGADGQMLYEAPPGMMVYEEPPPARFNISPDMFHKLMSGGAVTEQELHADSSVVSGAAPQQLQQQRQAQHVQYTHPAQTLTVSLPADAFPGKTYQVQAPDGRLVSFQVPAGCGPGSSVQVSY